MERKTIGGLLLVIGAIFVIYGFVHLNSMVSQAMSAAGRIDVLAWGLIIVGAVGAYGGWMLRSSK